MKKICIMLLISMLLITACSKKDEFPAMGLYESTDIITHSELIPEFFDLKASGASSSQLGDFISNNMTNLSEIDTSILITEIIKSASYDKAVLSSQVYDFPNMNDVYAGTFKYVWDINKIEDVDDSKLQFFFDELARSYYKIDTHKNYLSVDIDYDRLSSFDNLSKEIRSFLDINKSRKKLLLDAAIKGEINYISLRNTIVDLERYLNDYPNTELLYEAETLYRNLISIYFIGSDGLDPYDYENKKFKDSFFDTLLDTSLNFPLTMFSDISTDFLNRIKNENKLENIDYISLVSNYRKMGLKNKNTILAIVSEKSDTSSILYPQFSSFENKDIQMMLNDKVKTEIESIKNDLNWNSNIDSKYNISYFINYGSYKYISIQLTGSSFDRKTKVNITTQRNLNFDITSGELILLSDLFDRDFDNYNDELSQLIKSSNDIKSSNTSSFDKLTKEPQFMISNLSIVLYFEKGEYNFDENYPVYVYIKHNQLKELLDFRSVYK